jgi:eukaryotic-like serine/threonine-protein kinase
MTGAARAPETELRAPPRYALGARLGDGGMGVVFEAHDRVLDRVVAIKFLHDELLGAALQTQLTDEARTMARLSHPNVVTVYDVGEEGGRTYLAMELVRGRSMTAWLAERRDWREVVAMFRGIGAGLAAAHAAGIIHRDIKPGNLLVGDDGRGRVADFGIALPEEHAHTSSLTGTPLYMAPERRLGTPADARADQYAFCVVLYEALHGRLPFGDDAVAAADAPDAPPPNVADVPAWLHAAVARGLARDPDARFPSMTELVDALSPPRRTALWVVGGALGVGAIATAAVLIGRESAAADRCEGGEAELAVAWNASTRGRVVTHLQGLGAYGATQAAPLAASLDHAGSAWIASHRRACQARTRGEATDALYERRMVCLARSRASIAAAIDVLGGVTADKLPDAVKAVRAVDTSDDCSAPDPIDAPPPPALAARAAAVADQIAAARVRALAGEPGATDLTAAAVTAAEALDYAPLVARAHLVHGHALMPVDRKAAIAPLAAATREALALGDDGIAVEAYARAYWALGTSVGGITDDPAAERGLDGFALMEPIAMRLRPPAFARTLFYNNAGSVAHARSDRAGARAWYTKAYDAVRAGLPVDQVELANVPANLSLVEDDPARRRALLDEAAAGSERALGADHPQVLAIRGQVAMELLDPRAVVAALEPPCERLIALHPQVVVDVSWCAYELGWLAAERGDRAAARAAYAHVAGSDTFGALAQLQAQLLDDDRRAAATPVVLAFADREAAADEWWRREYAMHAYLAAGQALAATGDAVAATRALVRAVELGEEVVAINAIPSIERRLVRARAQLARILPAADPRRRELASAALAWYRAAGGYDADVAALSPLAAP